MPTSGGSSSSSSTRRSSHCLRACSPRRGPSLERQDLLLRRRRRRRRPLLLPGAAGKRPPSSPCSPEPRRPLLRAPPLCSSAAGARPPRPPFPIHENARMEEFFFPCPLSLLSHCDNRNRSTDKKKRESREWQTKGDRENLFFLSRALERHRLVLPHFFPPLFKGKRELLLPRSLFPLFIAPCLCTRSRSRPSCWRTSSASRCSSTRWRRSAASSRGRRGN